MAPPGSEALHMVARARAIAAEANAYKTLLYVAINESHLLEGAGEHDAAAEVARQGVTTAEDYGLFRTSGTFLAINLAEPLVALGRWDEATEVLEHARDLLPPPINQASLDVVAGLIAAARGDAGAAAQWAAASRAVLDGARFKDQHHLPLAQLEIDACSTRPPRRQPDRPRQEVPHHGSDGPHQGHPPLPAYPPPTRQRRGWLPPVPRDAWVELLAGQAGVSLRRC